MGVSSGQSRLADLTFKVFGRAVHPEWLSEQQFARVSQSRWEADIRIIKGGHAILFRAGTERLAEVLAETETELPDAGLLYKSPLKFERSTTLQPAKALSYQTCFEVERVDPEVFDHLTQEMTLDATPGRLFHRFRPLNRMAPAPISHIRIEARPQRLSVHTFHSFPDERGIIRTQSLFELPPPPGPR